MKISGLALYLGLSLCLASDAGAQRPGALAGHIVDAEDGRPIDRVTVVVEGLDRATTSDAEGRFFFAALPSGDHVLQTLRIGYHDARFAVQIAAGDTAHIDLRLGHRPLQQKPVLVEGHAHPAVPPLQEPEVVFSGAKLHQNLGTTVAATINYEPGIAQRSMGPAPARPVLRGLGGDRLLVLEDGERTGDLSATSSDHAVAIEPMTTERIELLRGPRTLLYGSNALGGVVNVVRGYVPAQRPARRTGALTWQGQSVNGGLSGGVDLTRPLGPLALRLDGSLRRAGDIATPRGDLANTDLRTGNAAAGLSLVRPWGHLGAAAGLYDSRYGIPPDPLGGHPNGVSIDLERRHFEARAEFLAPFSGLERLALHHTFSRYRHGEFEANGALGTEFGLLTHNSGAMAHLGALGPLRNGAAGLWYEYRNYAAAGLNFTPPATERAIALFTYQEWDHGPWAANAALRVDARRVDPRQSRDSSTVGRIRRRDFAGLSGGLSALYDPSPHLTLGATVMRTFRAPGIEELFSEGPHLAAYAYEVGNADLDPERGFGLEVFADYHPAGGHLHLALFRNAIDGYIFPKNSGQPSQRRADLLLYRTVGQRVLMHGAEAAVEYHLARNWEASGTLSYVRGRLVHPDPEPLPRLPPLQGRLRLLYEAAPALDLALALRLAAAQNRPGRFEKPTDGYAVFDLSAQYNTQAWGLLHSFSLTLENAADAQYSQHLNRVKDLFPEPGRNLRLLHKLFF